MNHSNVTVTAGAWDGTTVSWEPIITTTYTVTYNGNGNTSGTAPVDSTAYNPGAQVTVKGNTGNLAKTGYTFVGWNTKTDGTGSPYSETGNRTFLISANTILYAQWEEDTYDISGDVTDGVGLVEGATVTLMQGSQEVRSTTTDADGKYRFTGVRPGFYNVKAAKRGDDDFTKIMTILVEIENSNATEQNIELPEKNKNSEVTVDPARLPLLQAAWRWSLTPRQFHRATHRLRLL